MVLHFFMYEKFTEDYIQRINALFNPSDHVYLVYREGDAANSKKISASNVIFNSQFPNKLQRYKFLIKNILKSDKVILHALFLEPNLIRLLLFLYPYAGNKYFWNIWGFDLYNAYWDRNKDKKYETLRKKLIKKIKAVGYIPSDYEFLKKHYNTKAKFYLASYSYDFYIPEIAVKSDSISILLGNSATESCRYDEMIDTLAQYKNMPIKVYCILSYPDNKSLVSKVSEHGINILGDKFVPVTNYMNYDEYTRFLNGIDIAVFNHNRQQALGNIASLLYLGKRVFINRENGCKSYFEAMGAKLYDITELNETQICKMDNQELKEHNKRIIDEFFSDSAFQSRWKAIFEEKY